MERVVIGEVDFERVEDYCQLVNPFYIGQSIYANGAISFVDFRYKSTVDVMIGLVAIFKVSIKQSNRKEVSHAN